MNASRLLLWAPVLILAASVNAASLDLDKAQAFELKDVGLSQVADYDVAANRPKRTLNQRISDKVEKARRNREARKMIRQQREKREQERKEMDKAGKKEAA